MVGVHAFEVNNWLLEHGGGAVVAWCQLSRVTFLLAFSATSMANSVAFVLPDHKDDNILE